MQGEMEIIGHSLRRHPTSDCSKRSGDQKTKMHGRTKEKNAVRERGTEKMSGHVITKGLFATRHRVKKCTGGSRKLYNYE